jgi:hypothetical protein
LDVDAMKTSLAVALVAFLAVGHVSTSGETHCAGKPHLSFSISAKEESFHSSLGGGLEAFVVRDDRGWEVQVFRTSDRQHRENLLYPPNWHGAFPCQIQPGVGPELFPDERLIPIRTTSRSLCIRLIGVKSSGAGADRHYTSGTVTVSSVGV